MNAPMATRPTSTCWKKYGDKVPVRENEWDSRHFWRVSNAEHLAMSEDCGIVNLSHYYMFDDEAPTMWS